MYGRANFFIVVCSILFDAGLRTSCYAGVDLWRYRMRTVVGPLSHVAADDPAGHSPALRTVRSLLLHTGMPAGSLDGGCTSTYRTEALGSSMHVASPGAAAPAIDSRLQRTLSHLVQLPSAAAATAAAMAAADGPVYDLLIRGGRVIDPASGLDLEPCDVAVRAAAAGQQHALSP